MEIKRFRARDSRTALAQVRAALGPEAVILANRRLSDGVEVVATADFDGQSAQAAPEAAVSRGAGAGNELAMQQLQNELAELRSVLENRLQRSGWRDSAGVEATQATLQQRLARLGLSRTVAGAISDALPGDLGLEARWRLAQQGLAARLVTPGPLRLERGEALACVGATGVGKTSTLAKLAGRAVLRYGPDTVALVSTDTRRAGAYEQLAAYAEHLGVPVARAGDAGALDEALQRFRWRRVFVDTAGASQRDPALAEQSALLAGRALPLSVCLVLSAVAQSAQTREIAFAFGRQAPAGAIITKIDEATSLGGVLDALVRTQLPVLMFCDGQRVPDDMQAASASGLVQRAVALMEARERTVGRRSAARAAG